MKIFLFNPRILSRSRRQLEEVWFFYLFTANREGKKLHEIYFTNSKLFLSIYTEYQYHIECQWNMNTIEEKEKSDSMNKANAL